MNSPSAPVMAHSNLSITQANQQVSRLLRLPAEMRLIIYQHIFIGSTVHIGSSDSYSEPPLDRRVRMAEATALLRTCIQIRHEARATFYKYCTFDFTDHMDWPDPFMAIGASIAKDLQLIAISEPTARKLQHQEYPDWRYGPNHGRGHYQNQKTWIRSSMSLRRVAVEKSIMFAAILSTPPATVEGVRRIFDNDDLEVDLWIQPEKASYHLRW